MTCLIAAALLSGCTDMRLRSLGGGDPETSSMSFEELSSEERMQLDQVLEGEIQTVYASDTGLARVYGQVANFSEVSYDAVKFEVVATLKAASESDETALAEDSEVTRVVGTFIVTDFAAGDIDTFDVQTAIRAGDTSDLQTRVAGVR